MNFKTFLKENIGLILLAILVSSFLLILLPKNEKANVPLKKDIVIEEKVPDYQYLLDSIEAKSYYVYDILDKKSLFSKDEHLKLPLASITKLMSGFVSSDIMPATTIITINKDDIAMEGDSGFQIGEKWKLKDLLDYSLITSSNDGMHAVSSALNYYLAVDNKDIFKIMNERAKSLNLNDTIFINETGLDIDSNLSGAYSSAYDVSMLLDNIVKNSPSLISSTNKQSEDFISESNIKHTAFNTNTSINKISGLIASKTGFTDLAGGNVAIIFDAGFMHPIIIVVLGSSADGRFNDLEKLVKITNEKLSM